MLPITLILIFFLGCLNMQSDLAHVVFIVFDLCSCLNDDIIFVNGGVVDRLKFNPEYRFGVFIDGIEFERSFRKVNFSPCASLVRVGTHPLF